MPPAADDARDDGTDETPVPFGQTAPTRFAADVTYRGGVGEHHYVAHVRHRLLDTSFRVVIDGLEHDPKAEEKARKKKGTLGGEGMSPRETSGAGRGEEAGVGPGETSGAGRGEEVGDGPREEHGGGPRDEPGGPVREGSGAAPPGSPPADGLRFRLEENFTVTYCTVRRPDEDGDLTDAEVIAVRTAGLGGAGEVDVRQGLTRRPLAPDEDSPSAARDRRRTAHPTRFALIAALTKAAAYLIPLLGLGALFSGVLEPVIAWIVRTVSPVVEAVMEVVRPLLEWIDELLRPVREFIDAVTRPVREFIAALLQPVRDFLAWLRDLLLGWIPDLSLPFDVPEWVIDLAIPVIVVLVVFVVTFRGLRRRRERLEAARASSPPPAGSSDARDDPDDGGGDAASGDHDATSGSGDAASGGGDAASWGGDADERDDEHADRSSPS